MEEKMDDDGEIAMILGLSKAAIKRMRKKPEFNAAYDSMVRASLVNAIPKVSKKFLECLTDGKPSPALFKLFFEVSTSWLKGSKAEAPAEDEIPMTPEQYQQAQKEVHDQIKAIAKKSLPFPKVAASG